MSAAQSLDGYVAVDGEACVELRDEAVEPTMQSVKTGQHGCDLAVFWEQEWLGRMLSTENAQPSALCYIAQAVCVAFSVFLMTMQPMDLAKSAGMDEPNALLIVSCVLGGLASLFLILVISSAQQALCQSGWLEQLCRAEINRDTKVKINKNDLPSFSRIVLLALSAISFLFGLSLVTSAVLELPLFVPPNSPIEWRIFTAACGLGFCCMVWPIVLSGWFASMFTASCLCRTETIRVINVVDTTDPTSTEWKGEVAEAALKGLKINFDQLSIGWAGGTVGMFGSCWLLAVAYFAMSINAEYCAGFDTAGSKRPGTMRTTLLVFATLFFTLPFLAVIDVAQTSSTFDTLIEKLNDARVKFGLESERENEEVVVDQKITWLETSLRKMVRCQPGEFHASFGRFVKNFKCCMLLASCMVMLIEQQSRAGLQAGVQGVLQGSSHRYTVP